MNVALNKSTFLEDDPSATERYTTWSNMVKQQQRGGGIVTGAGGGDTRDVAGACDTRGRARNREENNINNNMDSSRKSR